MNIEPVHSKDGHTYWVESGDTLYIRRLEEGQYQKSNWVFAQTLIDSWKTCIDVGSNNACNAIHYAKKFDLVQCFEPTPLAQQLWANTIHDNSVTNCLLYKNAVGECQKHTDIIIHQKNGGHNYLNNDDRPTWKGQSWVTRQPRTRNKDTVPVNVETIDSYNFSDVGFIKIDVEGYEKFVLEGAIDTIKKYRPTIQLEIVANQCRKFGYWGEDMIEWIRSWDYEVVSKKRGVLEGRFHTEKNHLLYQGDIHKGEMDLWFQPRERSRNMLFQQLFQP